MLILFRSPTPASMAKACQEMVERFGITEKILAVNADNATANDKQTTALSESDNSFKEENRVRCFNHTLQLSAKALLRPFNPALGKVTRDDEMLGMDNDNDQLLPAVDEEESEEEEDKDDEDENDKDDEDDGIDEMDELGERGREQVIKDTAAVHETVTKVRSMKQKMFAFIY